MRRILQPAILVCSYVLPTPGHQWRAAVAGALCLLVAGGGWIGLTRPSEGTGVLMAVASAQPDEPGDGEVAYVPPQPERPVSAERASSDNQEPPATFDGRPLRKVETITMTVTAYSPHAESCGQWADGWTASGYSVRTNGGRLVAADTDLLPFGTIVSVPGYHEAEPVQVLDVGGAIKGKRLDVLYPTHQRALQWGVQEVEVTVWEYADE